MQLSGWHILFVRPSDGAIVKATIKSKARRSGNLSGKARVVNFVVMVVNGLSVLESMDSYDEGKKLYNQMIAKEFNNPYLSFKGNFQHTEFCIAFTYWEYSFLE